MKFWVSLLELHKKKDEGKTWWLPWPYACPFLFQDPYPGGFPAIAAGTCELNLRSESGQRRWKVQRLELTQSPSPSISWQKRYFYNNPDNMLIVNIQWKQEQVDYANCTGLY